ncbi:MAG: hypothetical protein CL608_08630 [Anaerolineaceae bacterium]|nr:hypothetical protein [Anaerolineaceae bacterium]
MCLALYIGSAKELPEIKYGEVSKEVFQSPEWPAVAQRFTVSALNEGQEVVRKHFSVPFVSFAGSYEGCSCGFNYGREYPEYDDDKEHQRAAQESIVELVRYIRDHEVEEIYACWFDDESLPLETIRKASLDDLSSPTFMFKQKGLIKLTMPPNNAPKPAG